MSRKKTQYEEFENSTIHVIKSNEYQNFSVKLAEEIGLEKACILANINDARDQTINGLHRHFPYISKDRLDYLVNELISEGHLEVKSNG